MVSRAIVLIYHISLFCNYTYVNDEEDPPFYGPFANHEKVLNTFLALVEC